MILYAYDRESGEYLGPVQCQVEPAEVPGGQLRLRQILALILDWRRARIVNFAPFLVQPPLPRPAIA